MIKLSDLTDVEKLKALGNTVLDNAKTGVDKLKTTVSENVHVDQLVDKVKSTINSDKNAQPATQDELHTQVGAIRRTLEALHEAQKQQLAVMNTLQTEMKTFLSLAESCKATVTKKTEGSGTKH